MKKIISLLPLLACLTAGAQTTDSLTFYHLGRNKSASLPTVSMDEVRTFGDTTRRTDTVQAILEVIDYLPHVDSVVNDSGRIKIYWADCVGSACDVIESHKVVGWEVRELEELPFGRNRPGCDGCPGVGRTLLLPTGRILGYLSYDKKPLSNVLQSWDKDAVGREIIW
jgi:hypothetical protein